MARQCVVRMCGVACRGGLTWSWLLVPVVDWGAWMVLVGCLQCGLHARSGHGTAAPAVLLFPVARLTGALVWCPQDGWTPLRVAAVCKHRGVCLALLEAGAKLELVTDVSEGAPGCA